MISYRQPDDRDAFRNRIKDVMKRPIRDIDFLNQDNFRKKLIDTEQDPAIAREIEEIENDLQEPFVPPQPHDKDSFRERIREIMKNRI